MNFRSFISRQTEVFEDDYDFEKINEYGLYRGMTGVAIFYFILFRFTENKKFENKAKSLLDTIAENIVSVEMLNYADGLAGVGWAVEWIVQNKFVNANTDEVLEDVDDTIYKSVLYSPDKKLSLDDGTLSKAAYFLKRYESRNPGTHRYKTIYHQECLVILTDEIKEKLLGENGLIYNDLEYKSENKELTNLGQTILFLSKFISHQINIETVEKTFYETIKYTEHLLMRILNESVSIPLRMNYIYSLLYLSYSYYQVGFNCKCQHWQQRGLGYFDKIFHKYAQYIPLENIGQYIPMLSRIYHQTGKESYSNKIVGICQHINLEKKPLALKDGIGEILLGIISYISPEMIEWDETMLYS